MKGFGDQNKSKKKVGDLTTKQHHYQILNNALKNHSDGNISQAGKSYQYLIDNGFEDTRVFNNYGMILISLGKLKDAELSIRKAIELNPKDALAHSNLGGILKELGKLNDAELSIRKAIELNPKGAAAHSNLGVTLKELGKLKDSELSIRKAIELNPTDAAAHSNLGVTLKEIGKLKDAELSIRKAIELNPNLATAYVSLGHIFKEIGKLKDAELSICKAIELNPNLATAFYSLSTLNYSNKNQIWQDQLFSENILKSNSKKDHIDIYFARANILHKEKNYKESARYLQLANELKLMLNPSNADVFIKKSQSLLVESQKANINQKENKKYPQSIFIVGMPRSGSTLTESILSMNTSVKGLGEVNIFEESFEDYRKNSEGSTLAELYWQKVNNEQEEWKITTNKWLYNYQYTGIIASQIPNVIIIHSFRNPLDNILSIYRANFARGNKYSSSLVDCAKIYLNHENIMTKYKNKFRSNIYDLNYDSLVSNPKKEIKSLISYLGWEWDDAYLAHHLNRRSVTTASVVQVRSPINSKSIGGWKNYKEMLTPAIEILTKDDRYRDLTA
ncbi:MULTISPECIES: tetratricopeptide repeat-containing sulfotransferase family protein [Prochlorococcus]|uniref:tetratricopeptide repeat-containing sulfotransferase family protein n=1 Tax=Prochlorococcus TaxID=1218 RepID=UPI0005336E0D|nr:MULTISPECIES: sulfotransferase family protein [Prochlorococcus]KGG13354.1 hypothetical protein EV05_1034 [Prochlorococcus sp. MIT 0601]